MKRRVCVWVDLGDSTYGACRIACSARGADEYHVRLLVGVDDL
jgi:hypothetical protein